MAGFAASLRNIGPAAGWAKAMATAIAAADLDPDTGRARLSYRRAAELFKQRLRRVDAA